MPALSHIGLGLASKRVIPQTSVIILVLAPLALDILAGVFWLMGVVHILPADADTLSWSHSLVMALAWSLIAAILVVLKWRNMRTGVVIGLLVFSHWLLDFIMWPPSASLLYDGGPKIGLSLSSSIWVAIVFEFGVFFVGMALYIRARAPEARTYGKRNSGA